MRNWTKAAFWSLDSANTLKHDEKRGCGVPLSFSHTLDRVESRPFDSACNLLPLVQYAYLQSVQHRIPSSGRCHRLVRLPGACLAGFARSRVAKHMSGPPATVRIPNSCKAAARFPAMEKVCTFARTPLYIIHLPQNCLPECACESPHHGRMSFRPASVYLWLNKQVN